MKAKPNTVLRAASVEYCQRCGSFDDNTVTDSRINAAFVLRRKRKCYQCGATWRTMETREDNTAIRIRGVLVEALEMLESMRIRLEQIVAITAAEDGEP